MVTTTRACPAACFRGPRPLAVALAASLLAASCFAAGDSYDPLAVDASFAPVCTDLVVHDRARQRDIPIRVDLPRAQRPVPVILFSHGLGGSCRGSAFLGRHWSARGYAVVYVQHPGSDESVWRGAAPGRKMAAMREAASGANFMLRVADVPAVLDQLETWNRTPGHPFAGRLDPKRIGMSGHSFGAVTTQAVSGQTLGFGTGRFGRRAPFTDPRITAALALSPSAPRRGDPARAFGAVTIPWMLMTGTRDVAPIGDTNVESRLKVFPALPPGRKYELVLDGAEHTAFTDRALPGEGRSPNHHRVILALSTAFWDAFLGDDPAARAWLDGAGPRSVLQPADRWQTK